MGNSPSKKQAAGKSSSSSKTKSGSFHTTNTNTNPPLPTHTQSPTPHQQDKHSQPHSTTHSTISSDPAQPPRLEADSSSSKGGGASSAKKYDELFEKYRDKESDSEQIGPDGIEQLCKDVNVDPEDVLVLVFAWYLNAQRMGFFSKEEFIVGLQKLGADSISKLKSQMSNFKRDLDDQAKFKDIYRFAFGFAKEKEQKIIDLATADALLALVLGNRYPHTAALRQYLQEQTTYKSVNLDQWMNILEFSRTIKGDLSNYDENSAWPVLLDEYCEWAKKRTSKT